MQGNLQKRSKGSWRLRYDGPPDGNGRRRQVTETIRGTRKEAERVLRERIAAAENGGYVPKARDTVNSFLKKWIDTYVATNTTVRTLHGYQGYIDRYITPTIGSISLQSLTALQVQKVYADLQGRGLSANTIGQLHRIFKESLSHAVKWGILSRNVAEAVTPPKAVRNQTNMWDVDTILKFLESTNAGRFGKLYRFATLTGMRRSEICGLKWECVDLPRSSLSVVNTLQRIGGYGLVEGQPKTAKSRRSIALSPDTVELMHGIRGLQMEQQLSVGDAWREFGYVFTEEDGSPIVPDQVTQDFARVVKRLGLPYLSFHGLRHVHATLLLSAGTNPKVVSERLGHSNIAITMDIYSHVLPGLQEAAALAIDKQIGIGNSS
jgi:integrase